jgi:hypothetical protein
MKEIKTIKMVEQTEVKFIADDGREFIGENAEYECKTYERRCNRERVIDAFDRLDVQRIDLPLVEFWYGDYTRLWKVTLHSKRDYLAFVDYLIVEMGVYKGDMSFEEPKAYPYTTLVGAGCEWAYEYGGVDQMKEQLNKMMEQLD